MKNLLKKKDICVMGVIKMKVKVGKRSFKNIDELRKYEERKMKVFIDLKNGSRYVKDLYKFERKFV